MKYAVLRETSLTTRNVLSHEALSTKLTLQGMQERKNIAELAKRSKDLKKQLEADNETNARLTKLRQKTVRHEA